MITEREKSAGRTTNHESKLPNGKTMTREDIIRMVREAEFTAGEVAHMGDNFIRFAEIVAAHEREECVKMCAVLRKMAIEEEREECAKVCVEQIHNMTVLDSYPEQSGAIYQAIINIRARGEI